MQDKKRLDYVNKILCGKFELRERQQQNTQQYSLQNFSINSIKLCGAIISGVFFNTSEIQSLQSLERSFSILQIKIMNE